MSYKRFLTSGLILDSQTVGEDGFNLTIFTENLGMIKAKAGGVRKSYSKMRPHLNLYSFGKYELIKGRIGWRVVGASTVGDFQFVWKNKLTAEPVARVLFLLFQLVPETEVSVNLFRELERAFTCLAIIPSNHLTEVFLNNWEHLTVMRLLNCLGYLSFDKDLDNLVKIEDWGPETVNDLSPYRHQAVFVINQGLASSHLVRF
ncbi:MAG: DNA repair protein RecO [Patescibacteria group bacterium]